MDKKLLTTALKAGKAASEILARGFGKQITIKEKNSGVIADVVTKYDLAAQKAILKIITGSFPDHSLLAEEGVSVLKPSDYQWIVDPLDGTTNFSRGIPYFSTSIGLAYKNKLVLGVISVPATRELFYAVKGQGAFRNNKKIKVSENKKLPKALIGVSMTRSKEALKLGQKAFLAVTNAPAKPRIYGSIATDLARVSMGALDGAIFNHMNPWDIAAGIVLVTEAGGKVSGVGEVPFSLSATQMVASNKPLHNQLLKLAK